MIEALKHIMQKKTHKMLLEVQVIRGSIIILSFKYLKSLTKDLTMLE